MKNYLFLFSACFFLIACSNNKDEKEDTEVTETETEILLWQSTMNDSTGRLELSHNRPFTSDTLTPEVIITYLNIQYPRIHLQLDTISNDTLYVSIPDAMFLTQQMGSSGPVIYFADAVYNLTEIPGIRYVSFNFEEGDHAAPSVDSRQSLMQDFRPLVRDSIPMR